MTTSSNDPNDLEALTPNHLLQLKAAPPPKKKVTFFSGKMNCIFKDNGRVGERIPPRGTRMSKMVWRNFAVGDLVLRQFHTKKFMAPRINY